MAAEWKYDPITHVYIDPNGRRVTPRQLVSARDRFAAARQAMLHALGLQLAAGSITVEQWEGEFKRLVAETITALHLFGAGGEAMVRARSIHIDRLVQALDRQLPFATQFIDQVRSGELSGDAIAARSELYVGAGVSAYEQARADDWGVELPYYPADHGTPCESNCRCSWIIETAWNEQEQRDVTTARWQTEGDGKVCDGCMTRAREWPGNVIG